MLQRAFDLAGRSERVVAVSRFTSLRDTEAFSRHGLQTIRCDLAEPAELARLPAAPTVFFLAGVKFGTDAAPHLLQLTNVELPQRVAAHFSGARIVALSTGCVYPYVPNASGGATEETPLMPVGVYGESCVRREDAFRSASEKLGTRVILVRLNYANEFRYGVLVDIARKVLAGQTIDLAMGYVNVIWQRDAVAYCIRSCALAQSPAVALNVTGADTLSIRKLADQFAERFDRTAQFAGHEEDTALLSNAGNSHSLFGIPPTPVEQMIDWVAAWQIAGHETWNKPTGYDRRDGRF